MLHDPARHEPLQALSWNEARVRATIAQFEAETARLGRQRHSLWTGDVGLAVFPWDCLHETPRFPTPDVFVASQGR